MAACAGFAIGLLRPAQHCGHQWRLRAPTGRLHICSARPLARSSLTVELSQQACDAAKIVNEAGCGSTSNSVVPSSGAILSLPARAVRSLRARLCRVAAGCAVASRVRVCGQKLKPSLPRKTNVQTTTQTTLMTGWPSTVHRMGFALVHFPCHLSSVPFISHRQLSMRLR